VARQLDRTLENIEALFSRAGAKLSDGCMFIAYVRDTSDIPLVRSALKERLGAAPFQVTLAPVCRPGWLVEIECMATVPALNPELPEF
jgi:enamine deaminase RidA (YjgF/YER057c/UK114 family)